MSNDNKHSKGRSDANESNSALQSAHRDERVSRFDDLKPNRGDDRIGIGSQKRLANVEKYITSGHKGYLFREERVEGAFAGGYELVRDRHGVAVTRSSGEDLLYLMQIPIEMWEQDQVKKHGAAVDAMAEAAMIDGSKGEYTQDQSGRAAVVTGVSSDPLY